jgi:hypothetical protein
MKIVPVATLAAALIAASAAAGIAQSTTTPQTNANTKVYAYKKTAPTTQNPTAAAMPPMAAPQARPFEHLTESVPYGSPKWWDIQLRSSNGD